MIAAQFLRNPVTAIPYTIHIILTDNGIQFTNIAHHKYAFHHIFDRICDENGIEHRPTKARHSWTNEQVERMNRTIKEATVKRYHYDSHDQFRQHLSGSTSPAAPRRLRGCLEFRPQAQNPQGPHLVRGHLQNMAKRARSLYIKPAPSNAGTKHLGGLIGPGGGGWARDRHR